MTRGFSFMGGYHYGVSKSLLEPWSTVESQLGVGQRIINSQILTSPSADAQGRLTYNLQTLPWQPADEPVADSGQSLRRVRDDAELPVYVQLTKSASSSNLGPVSNRPGYSSAPEQSD